MNIVDRVKNILITPKTEWEIIKGEADSIKDLVMGLDASVETGFISLAHISGVWRASAKLSGPASKLAVWTITGSTLKPGNADAFEIANRCQ